MLIIYIIIDLHNNFALIVYISFLVEQIREII